MVVREWVPSNYLTGSFSLPYKNPEDRARFNRRWRQTETYRKTRRPFDRHRSRLRKFGLTRQAYDEMLARQGGRCAICALENPDPVSLSVDHCHSTNVVRGLLCRRCNTGLGGLRDDPVLLRKAADYLERY